VAKLDMKQLCDGQTRFRALKFTGHKPFPATAFPLIHRAPSLDVTGGIRNGDDNTNVSRAGDNAEKFTGNLLVLNASTNMDPIVPKPQKRHRRSSKHQMAACCNCKRRRKKCDGHYPVCSGCKKLGLECTIIYAPTGREIKRNYIDLLESKVTKLETLLKRQSNTSSQTNLGSNCKGSLSANGEEVNVMNVSIPSLKMNHLLSSESNFASPMSITGSNNSVEVRRNTNDFLDQVGLITVGSEEDPRYVGETSAYSIARAISKSIYFFDDNGFYGRKKKLTKDVTTPSSFPETHFVIPSDATANAYLKAYKNTIQCQYPYMDWDEVMTWFTEILKNDDGPKSKTAKFFIYMIFAIGTQLLNPLSEYTRTMRMYYDEAFKNLDHMIHHNTIHTIQAYLMLAQFAQGMPAGASVWEATGMAIRSAVALGLHRHQSSDIVFVEELSSEETAKRENMRARVFWSAYGVERINGLVLGRPFSISDVDIDLPLPEMTPDTKIGCQVIKLRKIQSSISTFIYKPERLIGTKEELECTRVQIVLELNQWVKNFSYKERARSAFESNNWAMISYHNSLTVLLRPIVIKVSRNVGHSSPSDLEWFRTFAKSTAAICLNYKELYEKGLFRFMWMSVHCCFVAGISFIYSIWLDRRVHVLKWKKQNIINKTIGACNDILQIAANHWKSAEVFEETFQQLVNVVKSSLGDYGMTPPDEKDEDSDQDIDLGTNHNELISDLKDISNFDLLNEGNTIYSFDNMDSAEGTGPSFDSANFDIHSTDIKCDSLPTITKNSMNDAQLLDSMDELWKYFETSGGAFVQNVFNDLKQESISK